MRLTTIVAALILSVVVATKICAIEPEDLIGKWSGEYRSSSRSGSYTVYWIVTEVSGERVAGVFYWGGFASYHNREISFVGQLKGNVFSAESVSQFDGPPARWTFRIDESGQKMTGTFQAHRPTDVTLTKKK